MIHLFAPLVGFSLALLAAPVGVSGAFMLVPFLVSVVGIETPAASATSLMFNAVSTPGGIYRYYRQGRFDARLSRLIVSGTVPGVAIGAVVRVQFLAGPQAFKAFMGVVLLLLALKLWLELARRFPTATLSFRPAAVVIPAFAVGVVGGIYGIGGGSIMSPFLVAVVGFSIYVTAGPTLLATLITSVAGVVAFAALGVQPRWTLGLLLGAGGLAGSYVGAKLQSQLAEKALRALHATLATILGVTYLAQTLLF